MAKNKKVKTKHKILFPIVRFISFLITRIKLGYRSKAKYKIKKGESVLILSNHQTDLDPFCVITSFNRPIYAVGTDNIIASKMGHFMENTMGVIPKRKGTSDVRTTRSMLQTIKEGGSILVFPEGNRTYAEFQYYIAPSIVNFLKKTKITLVLFRLTGGTGVWPRFAMKKRKGPFYGEIRKVLKYEEYEKYSDEELLNLIKEELKEFDSESGYLYKSKARAEYIERMLFACPKCHSLSSIYSDHHQIKCHACDLDVTFNEDLSLSGNIEYQKLLPWWNYQKRVIKELPIVPDEIIFEDDEVVLKTAEMYEKKKKLFEGKMQITDKKLLFGSDLELDLKHIENASIISGKKLSFTHDGKNYMVVGNNRFNPIKYIFLFNKLDTIMGENKVDLYFNLKED